MLFSLVTLQNSSLSQEYLAINFVLQTCSPTWASCLICSADLTWLFVCSRSLTVQVCVSMMWLVHLGFWQPSLVVHVFSFQLNCKLSKIRKEVYLLNTKQLRWCCTSNLSVTQQALPMGNDCWEQGANFHKATNDTCSSSYQSKGKHISGDWHFLNNWLV